MDGTGRVSACAIFARERNVRNRCPSLTPMLLRADRNHIDVYVPQQDLVDSYLHSFQACVEEGKVSGVMVRASARGYS